MMTYQLSQIPLFDSLSESQNILLAGAGGGFDIFSGIPLFLALKKQNKNVHLANLSFASLKSENSYEVTPSCFLVKPFPTQPPQAYFPERFFCNWYSETYQEDIGIYAFRRTGVVQLTKAYQFLVEKLEIDTIILIDGGTDSLMFGQEPSLGTPLEDASSIAAVSQTKVAKKLLVCLGFGVDHFHGVNHYYFLKNVAELTKVNAFLGAFSLLNTMEEGKEFLKLVEYANQAHEEHPSIVSNSVASAVEGHFGDYHATYRTKKSELFINPLMNMYWAFELDAIAERIAYLPHLMGSTNFVATMKIIDDYIRSIDRATPRNLPL